MFYEEDQVKKLFCCQKCNKKYDEPRLLPCGKTLCNYCIAFIESESKHQTNEIKCLMCKGIHLKPANGFPLNEIVLGLMKENPKEVYRSQEAESLKSNLNEMRKAIDSFTNCLNNGADNVKEHCIELRRLVQLSSEQKIAEINQLNDVFIKQIDQYQAKCIQNCTTNNTIRSKFLIMINEMNKFYNEKTLYLKGHKITDTHVLEANKTAKSIISKLSNEHKSLESFIFNTNKIKFTINTQKLESKLVGSFLFEKLARTINLSELNSIDLQKIIPNISASESFFDVLEHDKYVYVYMKSTNHQNAWAFQPNNASNWMITLIADSKVTLTKALDELLPMNGYSSNITVIGVKVIKATKNIAVIYQFVNQSFETNVLVVDSNLNLIWNQLENACNQESFSIENDANASSSSYYVFKQQINNQFFVYCLNNLFSARFGRSNNIPRLMNMSKNLNEILYAKQMFIMNTKNEINILNATNGSLLKSIKIKAKQIEIDEDNYLLVLPDTNDKLIYYDLNGQLLKEIEIIHNANKMNLKVKTDENKNLYFLNDLKIFW